MIRHVTAVAFVCCLCPSWLCAQTTEFTVTTDEAHVYKAPSIGSPIIGQAARGTVFEVTRELGSWVRIPWPAGPDGGAYVHVSWGTVTHGVAASTRATGSASAPARSEATPPAASAPAARATAATTRSSSPGSMYVQPPTHLVGFGGRISGSTLGYGGTARAWSRGPVGLQFDASQYELAEAALSGRVQSLQIAPSVLYSFNNHVTDFVWVRPYVGGGPGFYRQTLSAATGTGASTSTTTFGLQSFAGGEFTFASVPQLAISADAGYRWLETSFAGSELRGPVFSVSAHWYVK